MVDGLASSPPTVADASPRFLSMGDGNEVLQVALNPGESVLASENAFCYRGLGLQQEAQLTEFSALGRALGWIGLKHDKVVKWTNEGTSPTYVGLSTAIPGKVIPVDLMRSGSLLAKPQMFLCSVMANQVTGSKLALSPEGTFPQHTVPMRKITGTGMCYIQAGGAAVQKALGRTESMMVEMGCVVAVSESCKIVAEERTGIIRDPPYPQGFVVKITGPGSVFVQSTHTGRFSKAVAAERSAQRVAGGGDMVKAAVVTLGILVLLFAFLDVEV
ncbi:unnamed protein product [Laminaria digitata]